MRHLSMESLYEYGSRAGLWRVLRAFEQRKVPLTIFAVAMALRRHPEATAAFVELGHEIACHGLRWISYQLMDEATERAHLRDAVAIVKRLTGAAPLGWYTGRDSPNTRRLLVEHGGFVYDADSYADDLPYWTAVRITAGGAARTVPHLVVPYTLDTNDMRFATAQGFNSGTQFFDYLKDAFDVLYREGDPAGLDRPKMLSIGLHSRLSVVLRAWPRSSDSSTTSSTTSMCGSAVASISRDTGWPRIPSTALHEHTRRSQPHAARRVRRCARRHLRALAVGRRARRRRTAFRFTPAIARCDARGRRGSERS